MDFKRLATKNAAKAFELAKSMGVMATFSGGNTGGYDFSTNTALVSGASCEALVIPLSQRRDRDGNRIISLMVQNVDIRAFTDVVFEGHTHKVGSLSQDNGVIKVFEAIRGA